MQSEMYNLFPAIGAVNAMRSNYNFIAQIDSKSGFGDCYMKISKARLCRRLEPEDVLRVPISIWIQLINDTA
jgi:deoxyribonuclease-1